MFALSLQPPFPLAEPYVSEFCTRTRHKRDLLSFCSTKHQIEMMCSGEMPDGIRWRPREARLPFDPFS